MTVLHPNLVCLGTRAFPGHWTLEKSKANWQELVPLLLNLHSAVCVALPLSSHSTGQLDCFAELV